ncbi:amidohydrolase [Actinocrinis puniceicyclus]|uniref:Amidohydrolase n=1 Tax=Actinocrinis puniceicyclus TaxID=977794 RepID=A0A8J7WNY9_9ACTN|nr:amidohydrolase [Actinocrinis puniceicyclus]MBS2963612.1 amidohydrolase [Actinocrinis puniceicyclus]
MTATPADLVLLGGPCFTADAARSWTSGVAVRAGVIAALGARDARTLIGPRTRVVELAGRSALPGFVDAHVHPVFGGAERLRCDLTAACDADEAVACVAAYAAKHPDRPWIVGGGWSMDQFPGAAPGRALLDAVVPDRPVFLLNRDHHDAWANGVALRIAGVDRDTPDPVGGRIAREPDGSPAGTLHEEAANLVGRHAPRLSEDDCLAALLEGQRHLHSFGVTGWQDAIVGAYLGYDDILPAYLRAAREGLLTGHVTGALWWDRNRGLEQIADLVERRAAAAAPASPRPGRGRMRAGTVKIMQDGICENLTAAMLDPYYDAAGRATGDRGHGYLDAALLTQAVTRLDALGFQVHVHAIGDRAVRDCLDAFEAAHAANGAADNRHHIAHLQVVHPRDVPRFRKLGVTATMQMLWAAEDGQMRALNKPVLGPERYAGQYPFGALCRDGAMLAAGSDWPVSSPDPLQAVHVAVNRVEPQAPPGTVPFLPEQALSLTDALAAYTAGSARVCHAESFAGSLEIGKRADLAVLDRDVFAAARSRIAEARVVLTVAAGEVVCED